MAADGDRSTGQGQGRKSRGTGSGRSRTHGTTTHAHRRRGRRSDSSSPDSPPGGSTAAVAKASRVGGPADGIETTRAPLAAASELNRTADYNVVANSSDNNGCNCWGEIFINREHFMQMHIC